MNVPSTASGPTSAHADAVLAAARDYIEGWYSGDAERMERSLHDDLVKRTLSADGGASRELRTVSKTQMVELTRAGGGTDIADPAIEISVDEVSGNIAAARVACADYVDFLHLVDTPTGWRIAGIVLRPAR